MGWFLPQLKIKLGWQKCQDVGLEWLGNVLSWFVEDIYDLGKIFQLEKLGDGWVVGFC